MPIFSSTIAVLSPGGFQLANGWLLAFGFQLLFFVVAHVFTELKFLHFLKKEGFQLVSVSLRLGA